MCACYAIRERKGELDRKTDIQQLRMKLMRLRLKEMPCEYVELAEKQVLMIDGTFLICWI